MVIVIKDDIKIRQVIEADEVKVIFMKTSLVFLLAQVIQRAHSALFTRSNRIKRG